MAKLGTVNGYEIMVFESEGNVPHFHFRNLQTDEKGCIKLLSNEYFKHGEYTAEMNRKDRKLLVEFLHEDPKPQYKKMFAEGLNNYDILCLLWDMNNDDDLCEKGSLDIPDYEHIK